MYEFPNIPKTVEKYVEGATDFARYIIEHYENSSVYTFEIEDILMSFLDDEDFIKNKLRSKNEI